MGNPMVLLAAYLSVDGNDWSEYTTKAEVEVDVDDQDVTTFASGGWKEAIGGLKSAKLSATFNNDFTAGGLDEVLWPLLGTVVAFEVRPANGPRSATNPGYVGNVLITKTVPISGSVGDVAQNDIDWTVSGAVARQTS